MAVLDELHEVVALGSAQRRDRQIVKDQQRRAGQLLHEPWIGAVATGDGDLLEQARQAEVASGEALATGLVGERTGQIRFAGTGRPRDEQIVLVMDPLTTGELGDLGALEPTGVTVVDVFYTGGGDAQPGGSEQAAQAAVVAGEEFAIEQQREALVEGELMGLGLGELLLEGLGHAGQAQGVQPVEGLLCQHRDHLLSVGQW